MSMQHIARIFLYHNVDCVEQALKVASTANGARGKHDEISDKEHAQIRQMDEHGIVRLSAVNGNQLDACSPFLVRLEVYGCVRLETAHIVDVEALTEKVLRDRPCASSSPSISSL